MKQSKIVGKPVFTGSITESISLADAKQHLYIESGNSDFDDLLTDLIEQTREFCEQVTCLSLVSKTVTVIVDYESSFTIPYGPVTSFTSASIKTYINTYDAQIIDDDFEIEAGRFISYVGNYRFKLVYVAGYTSSTLPYGLKLAMLNEIARRFEHRGDQVIVSDTNELLTEYKDLEWLM